MHVYCVEAIHSVYNDKKCLHNKSAQFMIYVYKMLIIIVRLAGRCLYLFIPIKSYCESKIEFPFLEERIFPLRIHA